MDGPYAFTVSLDDTGTAGIAWGIRDHEQTVGSVDVHAFLHCAVAAGIAIAQACRARRWQSDDLERLEQAIARTAT